MGEFLLEIVRWTLILIASELALAMACGTIFGAYFNAKKKYMRELNGLDPTDGR